VVVQVKSLGGLRGQMRVRIPRAVGVAKRCTEPEFVGFYGKWAGQIAERGLGTVGRAKNQPGCSRMRYEQWIPR
jgi:hypothetical protein